MKLKLSAKPIFIFLIILIITILTINYINRNSQLNSQKIQDIDPSKDGKTVGVNIEKNQPNGEKIKIFADVMEENKEEKFVKLINPITEIIKKNNVTKITSNYGYIINNYSKFKLDNNVNIYNSIIHINWLKHCIRPNNWDDWSKFRYFRKQTKKIVTITINYRRS